jgi:predicted lipoprotein with Yx(FWY)xxD motif
MIALKRLVLVVPALCIILLLASCGSTASASPSSSSSTSTSSTSSTSAYGSASSPTQAATTSGFVVKTAPLTVGGKSMTVLTDAQGKTLYYFTPDTVAKTACTGSCAETWPPLLLTGTTKVTAATKLPGELEVYKNPNGNQVIYNDHPLYTFSGDTGPGQSNGQGIAGQWFVATPTIAKNK